MASVQKEATDVLVCGVIIGAITERVTELAAYE